MTREESPAKHQSSSAPPKCSRSPRNKAGSFRTASASAPTPPALAVLTIVALDDSLTNLQSQPQVDASRFPRIHLWLLLYPPLPSVTHALYPTSQQQHPTRPVLLQLHTANSLAASPSGNPIIDDGCTLSKVYGSALQNPIHSKLMHARPVPSPFRVTQPCTLTLARPHLPLVSSAVTASSQAAASRRIV